MPPTIEHALEPTSTPFLFGKEINKLSETRQDKMSIKSSEDGQYWTEGKIGQDWTGLV